MTSTDLNNLHRDGFCILENVLSEIATQCLEDEVEATLARQQDSGRERVFALRNLFEAVPVTWELCQGAPLR